MVVLNIELLGGDSDNECSWQGGNLFIRITWVNLG